ncbi:non-ribosomal peptide synthetase [Yersinia rochesterensis]|uniref:non-ribosomal peptide synthetase n=1 Tax=Yersinia rochesterensis TaxID=1604335 RepID=UPI0013C41DD8|nr:non-ribosomal peptide synthetase [Yersinia rochesterensis]
MIKATQTVESIWKADLKAQENNTSYNEHKTVCIKGPVSITTLTAAAEVVLARHSVFSVKYIYNDEGLWIDDTQQVQVANITNLVVSSQEQALAVLDDAAHQLFDIYNGPLYCLSIIYCPNEEKTFVNLTAHHLIIDGWSFSIFFKELSEEYKYVGIPATRHLDLAKYDFTKAALIEHQSIINGHLDESLSYWKSQHLSLADNIKLPADFTYKSSTNQEGSSIEFTLKNIITDKIRKLSLEQNVSIYSVLMALYASLLYRYTEQETINIGMPVLNRHNTDEMSMIGCFVNTLALHLEFDENISFKNVLAHTVNKLNGALKNQRVPFPLLVKELNIKTDPSVHPLFQTMLTWLGKDIPFDLGKGFSAEDIRISRRHVKFDLLINIRERADQLILDIEYNSAVFKPSTISRIFAHFETLAESLLSDIDVQVSSAEILPTCEREEIKAWNATQASYPDTNILEIILAVMKEKKSSVALEYGNSTLTFGRLDERTAEIAQWLQSKTEAQFIGVVLERSFEMTMALLAIMRAGKAWVPIDPEYPQNRIDYMIQDSGVDLILTQEKFFEKLENFSGEAVTLENAVSEIQVSNPCGPTINLTPDSSAYMIYTSGSTGQPKGVINTHKGLFNRLYWMQDKYKLTSKDRVLQKTPFSFDVSVWEFFWPLMSGARIVIARPGGHRDTSYLKELIADKKVTVLHFVPSMLNAFLEEDELAMKCASLVSVFCSGEALSSEIIKSFYAQLPCSLHNLYGPTEAAIDVSFWECERNYDGNVVPIGKPVANTQLYVLNKAHMMQPIGVAGELFIAGVQLAEGYNNKPELTKSAFIDIIGDGEKHTRMYKTGDRARYNFDGNIEYLGRADHQIKLRGFRIELGEIEAIILTCEQVKESAVVLDESTGVKRLVAYLSLNSRSNLFSEDQEVALIKADLAQKLPGFMIPSHYIVLEKLPLSSNGKLDRRALPTPVVFHGSREEPQFNNDKEKLFYDIISSLIASSALSLSDNFFNVGGDSILALKLISELKKSALTLSLRDIYDAGCIADMVHMTSDLSSEKEEKYEPYFLLNPMDKAVVNSRGIDAWPMSVLQKGMVYHSLLNEESSIYHDIFSYVIDEASVSELTTRIEHAIRHNQQLQCVFDLTTCSCPIQIQLSEAIKGIFRTSVVGDLNHHLVRWEHERKQAPFDFESGPLVCFTLHTVDNRVIALSVDFHHAVLDGWSVSILINDIVNGIHDIPQIVEGDYRNGYATFVAAETEALNSEDCQAHWLNISRQEACQNFGLDVDIDTSTSETLILSDDFISSMRRLSREHSVPLKTVALYFHYLALSAVCGKKNICFGHVVNGRLEYEGSEKSLGLYLNTLPFIVEGASAQVSDLLTEIFNTEKTSLNYRRYPLANILKAANRDNLFDVVFNFTDFHVYNEGKNTIRQARYYEQTNFPVMIHFSRNPFTREYSVTLNYHDTDKNRLFAKAYIENLTQQQKNDEGITIAEDVAAIFYEVTGNHVDPNENYHVKGVDSISALRITALLRKGGYRVKLKDIVESDSLTKLWTILSQGTIEMQVESEKRPLKFDIPQELRDDQTAQDFYPLTDTQHMMVEKYREETGFSTYHDVFGYELNLNHNHEDIEKILMRLIAAHPVLRTSFVLTEGHLPLQKVHKTGFLNYQYFDLSPSGKLDAHNEYLRWFEAEKGNLFDFSEQDLVRFYSHKINKNHFFFTVSFHHSILDGYSLSNLIRLFVTDYQNLLEGRQLGEAPNHVVPAFKEFCLLSKEESRSEEAREFWKSVLFEEPILELSRPNIASSHKWSESKVTFNSEVSLALSAVAREGGISLKHLLQAVHFTVIRTLFDTPDLVSCTFSGGRTDSLHSDETLGMFLNFLPIRCNLSDLTVIEVAHHLRDFENKSLPYKRFSLSEINAFSQHKSYLSSCFNFTRFSNYQAIATSRFEGNDTSPLLRTLWFEHAHFGLLVNVGFDLALDEIVITLNAKSSVISPADLERLARMYVNAIRAIASGHHFECDAIHCLNTHDIRRCETGKEYETN